MLTDEELLDFDHNRLADFDPAEARQTLAERGDIYRPQLVAALFIDGWRARQRENSSPVEESEDGLEGFEFATREIAAHLRQGDFLPGGTLYEDEVRAAAQR